MGLRAFTAGGMGSIAVAKKKKKRKKRNNPMGSGGMPWAYGQIFLTIPNPFQPHWAGGIRDPYLPDEKARHSETMELPQAHTALQVY